MGRPKESSLIRDVVQVAVPIAPVISPMPETGDDTDEIPAVANASPPVEIPSPLRTEPLASAPPAPLPVSPPAKVRAPPRPSFSPPKLVETGAPPTPIAVTPHAAPGPSLDFRLADEAAKRHDYATADEILRERCTDEDASEPDFQALAAWVKANLTGDLKTPLNDLTFLLMAHHSCESALYYRGLLLKRTGKEKAALRDFVVLAKKNPSHVGALVEIKLLREGGKTS
jgi:hypothetical protein